MVSIPMVKCPRCGKEWVLRVPDPKQCPNPACGMRWPLRATPVGPERPAKESA